MFNVVGAHRRSEAETAGRKWRQEVGSGLKEAGSGVRPERLQL